MKKVNKRKQELSQLSEEERLQLVKQDQLRMEALSKSVPVFSASKDEDAEFSKGEESRRQTLGERYHQRLTDDAKRFQKSQKWRQRQAKKDIKRFGPTYIWSEKEKGSLKMAKAKKAAEEKEEKKAKKVLKASKKAAKKNGKKGKRGPRVVDGTIKLLAKENPKREGSRAWKKFELYKKNKTVASYLKAGGKRSSLRYDEKHGYIKLSNLKHKGDDK